MDYLWVVLKIFVKVLMGAFEMLKEYYDIFMSFSCAIQEFIFVNVRERQKYTKSTCHKFGSKDFEKMNVKRRKIGTEKCG